MDVRAEYVRSVAERTEQPHQRAREKRVMMSVAATTVESFSLSRARKWRTTEREHAIPVAATTMESFYLAHARHPAVVEAKTVVPQPHVPSVLDQTTCAYTMQGDWRVAFHQTRFSTNTRTTTTSSTILHHVHCCPSLFQSQHSTLPQES